MKQKEEQPEQGVIVSPEQFGLSAETAATITKGLKQILVEREAFIPQYDAIIKMDINDPETLISANELRKLIRDNRTKGIEAWHKANKEFWLRGGQFVDAIKRKEIAENMRMEENLEKIEKHFDNLEKERLAKLKSDREQKLTPYGYDCSQVDLSKMDEKTFDMVLLGAQKAFEDKVEAEAKAAAEAELKAIAEKLNTDRKLEMAQFATFLIDDLNTTNWGEMALPEYEAKRLAASTKKAEFDEQQRKIAEENERLKKEAEQRQAAEAKAKAEAEAKEKAIQVRYNARAEYLLLTGFILSNENFVFMNNGLPEIIIAGIDVREHGDIEYKKMISEYLPAVERIKKEIAEAKAAADAKEKQRIADEAKAAAEAEAKAKAVAEAKAEAERQLAMGDEEKYKQFLQEVNELCVKYQFKSEKYKKMYSDWVTSISKIATK